MTTATKTIRKPKTEEQTFPQSEAQVQADTALVQELTQPMEPIEQTPMVDDTSDSDETDTDDTSDDVTPLDKTTANGVINAIANIQNQLQTAYNTVDTMLTAVTTGMNFDANMVEAMRRNMYAAQGLSGDIEADLNDRLQATSYTNPKDKVVLGTLASLERAAQLGQTSATEILQAGSEFMKAVNASAQVARVKELAKQLDAAKAAAISEVFIPQVAQKFNLAYRLSWTQDNNLMAVSASRSGNSGRTIGNPGHKHYFIAPFLDATATYDAGGTKLEFHITSDDKTYRLRINKLTANGNGETVRDLVEESIGELDLHKLNGKFSPNSLINQTIKRFAPKSQVNMTKTWANVGPNGIYAD